MFNMIIIKNIWTNSQRKPFLYLWLEDVLLSAQKNIGICFNLPEILSEHWNDVLLWILSEFFNSYQYTSDSLGRSTSVNHKFQFFYNIWLIRYWVNDFDTLLSSDSICQSRWTNWPKADRSGWLNILEKIKIWVDRPLE